MKTKLLSFILIFSFCMNSAFAGTGNELKAAIDELNFSLTVEWDQQDKEFYSKTLSNFASNMRILKARGLKDQDVVELLQESASGSNQNAEMSALLLNLKLQNIKQENIGSFLFENIKNTYSKGSSWNGRVTLYTGLGVLLVASIVTIIIASNNNLSPTPTPDCNTWTCEQTCYNDPTTGYTCFDDCYYTCN